jgi:hypothetical protein
MRLTGRKTASVYRRYGIVDEADLGGALTRRRLRSLTIYRTIGRE